MKIFITGGTGWIGSATMPRLIAAGHTVVGLTRSEATADKMTELGGTPLMGSLNDIEVLEKGAAESDAVIHLAFRQEGGFTNFKQNQEHDQKVVRAMCEAMVASGPMANGSPKCFIGTSGTMICPWNVEVDEKSPADTDSPMVGTRAETENVLHSFSPTLRTIVVRLSPSVHGKGDKGFMSMFAKDFKEKGSVGYPSDGTQLWPGIHKEDAGELYALAIDKAPTKLTAMGFTSLSSMKDITDVMASRMGLENQPRDMDFFGPLGMLMAASNPCKNDITKAALGWIPRGPSLLEDLKENYDFENIKTAW